MKELDLQDESKPVVTPGIKPGDVPEEPCDQHELVPRDASMCRALVARANYLSQDRSDIQFAVKELSRTMSKPTVGDLKKLKRLGRYLITRTRSVVSYNYQANPKSI